MRSLELDPTCPELAVSVKPGVRAVSSCCTVAIGAISTISAASMVDTVFPTERASVSRAVPVTTIWSS